MFHMRSTYTHTIYTVSPKSHSAPRSTSKAMDLYILSERLVDDFSLTRSMSGTNSIVETCHVIDLAVLSVMFV